MLAWSQMTAEQKMAVPVAIREDIGLLFAAGPLCAREFIMRDVLMDNDEVPGGGRGNGNNKKPLGKVRLSTVH